MNEKLIAVYLTNDQRAMLRALVIAEAKRLGYGTIYHDDAYVERWPYDRVGRRLPGGRREWPRRLKRLSTVARKLMP